MRDERSVSQGLCAEVSTVNSRKGPPGGEVTSLTADPNRTQNPVTRHPPPSNSATASWAHLAGETSSRRMFSSCVSADQGFCFVKPWRERFFRCFRWFSAQPGCLWSFTRRSSKVTPGNLELATPGLAATGSPPWAAPAALISMWGEVELEGRFSLWAGTGWWARGDLVVLSRSHLRTGWQWGNRIPEVLFSVPVWIQGPQAVGCLHPRWRSVGRLVGMCLEGRCLGI